MMMKFPNNLTPDSLIEFITESGKEIGFTTKYKRFDNGNETTIIFEGVLMTMEVKFINNKLDKFNMGAFII